MINIGDSRHAALTWIRILRYQCIANELWSPASFIALIQLARTLVSQRPMDVPTRPNVT